ncbi:hypothetical protein L6452_27771 [Arctium lappa]|uniref:Uncharacterized protein n=1 Tax=Arctium lappa TaxID=4217 RepID=A0ACB8ZX22_ARCLA|nr:hypothetical protein L6452_27771 [Arctium lappa]
MIQCHVRFKTWSFADCSLCFPSMSAAFTLVMTLHSKTQISLSYLTNKTIIKSLRLKFQSLMGFVVNL